MAFMIERAYVMGPYKKPQIIGFGELPASEHVEIWGKGLPRSGPGGPGPLPGPHCLPSGCPRVASFTIHQ